MKLIGLGTILFLDFISPREKRIAPISSLMKLIGLGTIMPFNHGGTGRMPTAPKSSVTQAKYFTAQSLALESLVSYQEHSVVSKRILNKKAGTLTLFAFGRGEVLSEHTAPYDATVLILDGKATIMIGGKPHKLKKGEMIIMPAGIPHSLKAVERFKMLLIMIRS